MNGLSKRCLLLALCVLFATIDAAAADRPFSTLEGDPKEPWHIVCDQIWYDDKAEVYIATGNAVITKKNRKLSADYIRFDEKTMTAFAEGHVMMIVGEDVLLGEKMEMDLGQETGTLYKGTIFLEENHYYIRGDKIQKIGKDSYTAQKASITTCDGDRPAWKITGRNMKITIEGYGYTSHAALWAKNIPVFYVPFFFFPVKLKRQSGLLPPQFGTSVRKGAEYMQPFYWAINDSSDATFYLYHMDRRGEQVGLEYRYVLSDASKGTSMVDYLEDKKVDDGTPGSSDWGYDEDDVLRPNRDRYWFRAKHDQALPYGFFATADVDIVSDQDYLEEFSGRYNGFDRSKAYFVETFGRDIDEYDDAVRLNRFNVNKNWTAYSLNAEVRWYDDVVKRRQDEKDTTLQRLPLIEFDGSKQTLFSSPFYFDLDTEYDYFYREDGDRGQRVDAHPRLYLPLNLKTYLNFEPSAGVRHTVWYLDKEQYSPSGEQTLDRTIYDVKLDLSSDIYRIYGGISSRIDKIKHNIRPQIVYDYIPDKDQRDLPRFDSLDRVNKTNIITYSITNQFTSRSRPENATESAPWTEAEQRLRYDYTQFLRFKLEQSFDFNKKKAHDPEPYSPVLGELDITPGRYVRIDADAQWSHYDHEFRSRNVALTLWDDRDDRLFVEHRYKLDQQETIYAQLSLKLTDKLTVYGDYERNIFDAIDITHSAGFLYSSQCWSFDFRYIDEQDDQRYEFMISLFGVGALGQNLSAF
jgi:LPS-assembly protein